MGEIAKPERNRNTAERHEAVHERQRQHQQRRARACPSRNRAALAARQVHRPGRRRRRAGCPAPRARASARTAAWRRARRRARRWRPRRRRAAAPIVNAQAISGASTRHGIGPRGVPVGAAGRRRLGAALADQHRGAARPWRRTAAGQPGERVDRGGEHGHQRRADDEHRLVDDRLEGEGGVQAAPCPATRCDQRARTHEPICGIAGPGQRRRTGAATGRGRPASTAAIIPTSPSAKTAHAERQHPALPEPVDQPGLEHGEQRVRDEVRRGHRARPASRSRCGSTRAARSRG